jgi:hypothetical protein
VYPSGAGHRRVTRELGQISGANQESDFAGSHVLSANLRRGINAGSLAPPVACSLTEQ